MIFKIFQIIGVSGGMVVFYGVIETQCTWNFDRFIEFWGGKQATFRYRFVYSTLIEYEPV